MRGYLQLSPDKAAAVTTLDDTSHQKVDPPKQVFRIGCSGVAPFISVFARGWCDIDTSKFGVQDNRARTMLRTWIQARDGLNEHGSICLWSENALQCLAGLCQSRSIAVVVEGCEIGAHMLPATVVIDGPGGINGPGERVSVLNWGD